MSIHTELKHPHILRVIDRCETPSHYYLVLELATRTLQHWTQGFPQQRVRRQRKGQSPAASPPDRQCSVGPRRGGSSLDAALFGLEHSSLRPLRGAGEAGARADGSGRQRGPTKVGFSDFVAIAGAWERESAASEQERTWSLDMDGFRGREQTFAFPWIRRS